MVGISAYALIIFLTLTASGAIWNAVAENDTTMVIPILVAVMVTSTSIVLTHSLLHFFRERYSRSLLLLLMSFDIIILTAMYFISHPAFGDLLFPFADRNRNRTIVIAMGLSIFPSMLAGSLAGSSSVTKRSAIVSVAWGAFFIPALSFWFLLSPEPVFMVTAPSGGLEGLTPIAVAFAAVIGVTMSASFIKSLIDWYSTRDRVTMASTLALGFWLYAEVILLLEENPNQLAEIVWFGAVVTGFILIALAMSVSAVLEPRKILEETVEQRTRELQETKAESEFYLGMWSHKMGNILQAITMYLDLLSEVRKGGSSNVEAQTSARGITREASLLNMQVTVLSQLKDMGELELERASFVQVISRVMDMVSSFLNTDSISVDIPVTEAPDILGDEMLDIALLSIFSFIVRSFLASDLHFTVSADHDGDTVTLQIGFKGRRMPAETQDFLERSAVPHIPTIDLDLFVAKVIIARHRGTLHYTYREDAGENIILVTLQRAP
jgi:heme exporter protein D